MTTYADWPLIDEGDVVLVTLSGATLFEAAFGTGTE